MAESTPPPPRDAVDKAASTFGQMVGQVDFVHFVDDLITGVFQSIVDSSRTQMEAFADLVASVARSTDDYARTEIKESDAQNFLLSSMPNLLTFDGLGGIGKAPGADLDQMMGQLGGMGIQVDPSSPTLTRELTDQARLKLAAQRQQMLATLVLMGINRVVVTDGEINAKVVFDVKAQAGSNRARSSQANAQTANTVQGNTRGVVALWTGQDFTGQAQYLEPGSYNLDRMRLGNDSVRSIQIPPGWRATLYRDYNFSGPSVTYDQSMPTLPAAFDAQLSSLRIQGFVTTGTGQQLTVSTMTGNTSAKDDDWIKAAAQLTGEVGLRFRSETFPLEKFAPEIQSDIQKKATTDHGDTVV